MTWYYVFLESPSIEELAESQSVKPIADISSLFGTWPGEADDGFEDIIDELRHEKKHREIRSHMYKQNHY